MSIGVFAEIVEEVLYISGTGDVLVLPKGRLCVVSAIKSGFKVNTVSCLGLPISIAVGSACIRVLESGGGRLASQPNSSMLFVGESRGDDSHVMLVPIGEHGNPVGPPVPLISQHKYSCSGFSWGNGGPGAMDLAHALLMASASSHAGMRPAEFADAWARLVCLDLLLEMDASDAWSITSTSLLRRLEDLAPSAVQ